jgi:hypothetical protein
MGRTWMRRPSPALVISLVALIAALAGGAYAAISRIPDAHSVYHGCVNAQTGALRVVTSARRCHSRRVVHVGHRRVRIPAELAIAWNQKGQKGDTGASGAPGAPATIPAPESPHVVTAFANSWSDVGIAGYPVAYYKDPFGVVHLSGAVKGGTLATAAFTLPSGYRPAGTANFATESFDVSGTPAADRVQVFADGTVNVIAGNQHYVALDGVSFRAAG